MLTHIHDNIKWALEFEQKSQVVARFQIVWYQHRNCKSTGKVFGITEFLDIVQCPVFKKTGEQNASKTGSVSILR
jgi:hypothetical protein